ncbi:MAG: PAS domain S-box protein [Acidobacteria bacterium]|nr:PAS domain S-box protein [Acidobacteriota bacterium]
MNKLRAWLQDNQSRIGFSFLVVLIIVGLMNVIHVITFLEPTDGAVWEVRDGALVVVQTDLAAETSLQVGDELLAIDDVDVQDLSELEDLLYSLPIGSKHLFVLERNGTRYEPWVTIRGVKQVAAYYYIFSVSGFIYLVFMLLIVNQDIPGSPRKWMVLFSLCVFLAFVFHFTERFTPLDWISYFLDYVGRVLLPSCLLAIALNQTVDDRFRWSLQPLHWIPSLLLVGVMLVWIPQASWGGSQWGADFYKSIQDLLRIWNGLLLTIALVLINLPQSRVPPRMRPVWLMSWLPYTLEVWQVSYPGSGAIAAAAPAIVPLALLVFWSQKGVLYLGRIGKKAVVYVSVILLLFLGFFLFMGIFQALLGSSVGREGQIMISAFGIMFAVVSYDPLKNAAEELLGRLVYGKRFEAVRVLMDFSEFNRADVNIESFVKGLASRIEAAFGFDRVMVFLRVSHVKFDLVGHEGDFLEFRYLPGELIANSYAKSSEISQSLNKMQIEESYGSPLHYFAIRVHGEVLVIIALPSGPQDPRLSPDDLRLMTGLVNQCDVLLENMELYRSLNEKAQSISKLKEFNENIIESSRVGIFATDELEAYVSCNRAFIELAGVNRADLVGQTFEKLMKIEKVESHHMVRSTEFIEGIFRNQKGHELVLEVQKTPLKTKENVIYGTLFLVEDIHDKRKLQEQMMQQEKLASIGMLAAGVAHEINTPLTGIAGYSQLLMMEESVSGEQLEMIQQIDEQSRRAANIVKELLNFSRKESAPKGPVDALHVLRQTIQFLSHQAVKKQVQIHVNAEGIHTIDGYANQIQQVFINIIVNAMDAMPGGGVLDVYCAGSEDGVTFEFRDSGHGISPEIRSRIFDPFFTTKEAGKGTGLGLSVVYNIIRDHDAKIDVESQPNCGTTIRLLFPKSAHVESFP